jgi:hypothetical protein
MTQATDSYWNKLADMIEQAVGKDDVVLSHGIFMLPVDWKHIILALRSGSNGPKWIPVTERLPEENTTVFAAGDKYFHAEGQFHGGEFLLWDDATESLQPLRHLNITHWMEVPPHPSRFATQVSP